MNILHICSNFQYNPMYDKLLCCLEKDVKNTVIAPVFDLPTDNKTKYDYPVFYCKRDKGLINRLQFKKKIQNITEFTEKNINLFTIDLVHAHTWFSDGAVAYKLFLKYNIPYIVAVRDTDLNEFYKYALPLRKFGHEILENANKVIFINKSYPKRLEQKLPNELADKVMPRSKTIFNGIDDFWLNNLHQHESTTPKTLRLVYSGAFSQRKNVLTTIHAVDILKKKGLDVTFTAIGMASQDNSYQNLIKETVKGKSYIYLLSYMTKEPLMEQFRQHDIFIMPSFRDTFGLAYAEALTQGLPIIYSKDEGFDHIYPDGTIGYAVNPHSAKDIAEKIEFIWNRYAEFCQEVAKLQPFDEFNWAKIAKQYTDLYQFLVN